MNNQYQTLFSKLENVDSIKCRQVMSNYDSFMNRIQRKIFIQSFIFHIRSAQKSHAKEDDVSEKKSLILALNIIDSDKISEEDLRDEDLLDYVTGTLLTSEKIARRLHNLGRKES